MTTRFYPPLSSFTDWIRATDQHAAHHLPLMEAAARLLAARADDNAAARPALTARLERWR